MHTDALQPVLGRRCLHCIGTIPILGTLIVRNHKIAAMSPPPTLRPLLLRHNILNNNRSIQRQFWACKPHSLHYSNERRTCRSDPPLSTRPGSRVKSRSITTKGVSKRARRRTQTMSKRRERESIAYVKRHCRSSLPCRIPRLLP